MLVPETVMWRWNKTVSSVVSEVTSTLARGGWEALVWALG